MTTHRRDGGRTIELFLPFEHGGVTVTEIGLAPVTWNHTLKWQGGEYSKSTDLLFELAEQSEDIIKSIRYPDVDRVMTQFFEMLPTEIRESIAAGTIPRKVDLRQLAEEAQIENYVEEEIPEEAGEPIGQEELKERYEPYRMPTRSEIEEDAKAHPPPDDPWGHLPKDETGLGFEVDDG